MTIPYTFNRMGINAYAPPIDETDYLTFIANTSNSAVKLSKVGTPDNISLQYSKNKKDWRTYTIDNAIQLQSVGDKVYFRGNNNTLSKDNSNYYNFAMSGSINASGNVMSLLDKTATLSVISSAYCFKSLFEEVEGYPHLAQAPTLPATTISDHCYASMFKNCANLIEMPELPAVTLDEHCYDMMFTNCISLTGYTTLPASALYSYCYSHMFRGCTSLSSAGTLEFTDFAQSTTNACDSMFRGCSSLVVAPAISAQNTNSYCYKNMFTDCSSLSSITVKFTTWENNATNDWVQNVASAGTFTCPDGLSAEYGDSRIPTNWTISHGEVPMPTSGLVFYAPMTNTTDTVDQVGNTALSYVGSPSATIYQDVNCILMNPNERSYVATDAYPENLTPTSGTYSIWVNFPTATTNQAGGIFTCQINTGYGFRALIHDNDSAYEVVLASNLAGLLRSNTITFDEWHNLVFTFDGTYGKVYIDGVLSVSTSTNTTINGAGEALKIGTYDYWMEKYFTACRIYDRVLTLEEIQTLATEFAPDQPIPPTPPTPTPISGLVFYAPLSSNLNDEIRGNSLSSTVGTIMTNQTVDGIQCTKFDAYSYAYTNDTTNFPQGNAADITISLWYRQSDDNTDFNSPQMFVHLGNDSGSYGHSLEIGEYLDQWHWNILRNPYEGYFGQPDNNWHHLLLERDSTNETIKMYFDGVLSSSMSVPSNAFDLTYGKLLLCSRRSNGDCMTLGCYIAAVRLYNRLLSQQEISDLANEFT